MAQIMDFGVGRADLDSDLLEVIVDGLWLQRRSEERRESQGDPMLRLRLPTLPGNRGVFLLSDLLLIALLHQFHDVRGRLQDAALSVFRGSKDNASVSLGTLLQLLVDTNHAAPEIHAVPGDAHGFRLADAGQEDHLQQDAVFLILLGHLQKQRDLIVCQRLDLMLFHTGKDRAHTGIGSDKAIDNCDTHRLAQYTVRIFDGLRRNPLRAVRWLEQPIIKLLNIRLGKFSKRNTAELRLDVRLYTGTIILDGRILFVAAVLLQPEIQPLAQLHL